MLANFSVCILAGGKSSRMGADKALVLLNGRTLLDGVLEVARSVSTEVRIVGDPGKYSGFAPCIRDLHADCGPLGGIHAALRESHTDLNLMLAVDLPFVTPALLRFLTARATESPQSTVTVPRTGRGLQPLCAVYRREFAVSAEKALQAGRYKIDALFDPASTQVVEENVLRSAGFSPELFRNLNTPDDLAQAQ